MPTPRTEIRPTLLHQDPAGNSHVRTTVGSHDKPESAPVDKAVTNLANEILTKPRHGRDQALDKGAPADEEEPSHDEDPADVEESDDVIDDQMGRVKKTLRGEFAPATYMLSPVQGSFWLPPASKLLTNTVTLVDHLFTDFENYFRLVERLVP
ncbi:hypothetical protein E4U35_005334 [Claviceps purpurea]|nr:hypothetical protein E4U35_005334 [Claviceps purpurea]